MNQPADAPAIDAVDRAIVIATQGGMPLVAQPFHAIAAHLGITPEEVMARMRRMQDEGVIRRFGVVPNNFALGYRASGLSVWDVADDAVDELGARIGQFDFVSRCYRRARHRPEWNYNLYAMVHGQNRIDVEQKVAQIAQLLGEQVRARELLFSTRMLKRTGLRLVPG